MEPFLHDYQAWYWLFSRGLELFVNGITNYYFWVLLGDFSAIAIAVVAYYGFRASSKSSEEVTKKLETIVDRALTPVLRFSDHNWLEEGEKVSAKADDLRKWPSGLGIMYSNESDVPLRITSLEAQANLPNGRTARNELLDEGRSIILASDNKSAISIESPLIAEYFDSGDETRAGQVIVELYITYETIEGAARYRYSGTRGYLYDPVHTYMNEGSIPISEKIDRVDE